MRRAAGKSVTLAWDPSTDNSGSVTYVVSKDGEGFTVPQGQTRCTIDWLSAGRTYSFYVTASDRSLNRSAPSNRVTVTTPPDTTPPTTPQLSGSMRGPSQVSLTWTRSTDHLYEFVGYGIFANGARVTEHVNWYGETSVILRHLTPATSYTFTVHAHDFNGYAATSNSVTLTTEADDRRDAAVGADQRAHRRGPGLWRGLARLVFPTPDGAAWGDVQLPQLGASAAAEAVGVPPVRLAAERPREVR